MILAVLALAVSTETPDASAINLTAVIVAVVACLGALSASIGPIISKRLRGASDVRDDTTVTNQGLKDAAEVAMKLVESIQSNASYSLDMLKDSLEVARQQLESANGTIVTLQAVIQDLRDDNERNREHNAATLLRLDTELARAQHERDAFQARITDLEAQLAFQEQQDSVA